MSKNEICICLGSAVLFGAERRFVKIMNEMARTRPDVTVNLVVTTQLHKAMRGSELCRPLLQRLDEEGRLMVLPDRPADILNSKRVGRFVRLFLSGPAFHTVLRARLLAYLRGLLGKPAVIEVTSPDVARRIGGSTPLFVLDRVSRFVCVSPSVRNMLVSEIEKRRPRGIDAAQIHTAPAPYHEARLQPGLVKERLVVAASRFVPRKNARLFAEAVKLAAPHLPDWKFALLGQGEQEAEIRGLLAEEIRDERIFVGYVPDIGPYLARARLFVSLIEPDNYPSQSVLEAMEAGAALLLSDTGDSGVFLDAEAPNGRLVGLTAKAVADALVDMCSDENRLDAMGRRSAERVGQRYSAQAFIADMLAQHGIA